MTELQRDIIAAVDEAMQDGRKLLQADGIIENLAASHREASREQITENVVQVARALGAAVVWSAPASHN